MATHEYLRSAASSLHRAADSLRQQAHELHSQMTRTRHDKTTLINKNQAEIGVKRVEFTGVQNDDREKSRVAAEIEKLQQEIVAAQQELKQAEQQLQGTIQAKIGMSDTLENQAKQLDGQSSASVLD